MRKSAMRLSAFFITTALLISTGAAAEDHAIVQKDKSFSQEEITVKAGDTITFDNQDAVTHNIYSKDAGNEFEFAKQDPGQKQTVTLKTPGQVKVRCAIHPKMKLLITVQ
jgi:plastocyanin